MTLPDLSDSYKRATFCHDWAIKHNLIARVRYDGHWSCEIVEGGKWVAYE